MTNGEAARIRACLECGKPGAGLRVTTRGENPGRNIRVCSECEPNWWMFAPVEREPVAAELTRWEGTDVG